MSAAALLPWIPALAAGLVTVLAIAAAHGRWLWTAAVVVCGLFAIAAGVWQRQEMRRTDIDLSALSARLAETTGQAAPTNPDEIVRESADRLAELALRNHQLEQRLARLAAAPGRSIGEDRAKQLTDYLRRFGGHRVVLSCVPGDVEACSYATELLDILKQAGWDANGPEATDIYGTAANAAIALYIGNAGVPQGANILADAFTKFDIPHESRIAPSEAIPDPDTVELFVPPLPTQPPSAASGGG